MSLVAAETRPRLQQKLTKTDPKKQHGAQYQGVSRGVNNLYKRLNALSTPHEMERTGIEPATPSLQS